MSFFATKDYFQFLYPYFMLINGERAEAISAWRKVAQVDRRITYNSIPIPEIAAEGSDVNYVTYYIV